MTQPPQYWVLGVYFAAVVALTASILGLSAVLGERQGTRSTAEPFESGIVAAAGESAHLRFPVQFYLVAMFFVVFDLEAVFVYAWAVAARAAGWAGYIEVMVFIGILTAALAYLWRCGALDWTPRRSRRRLPQRQG